MPHCLNITKDNRCLTKIKLERVSHINVFEVKPNSTLNLKSKNVPKNIFTARVSENNEQKNHFDGQISPSARIRIFNVIHLAVRMFSSIERKLQCMLRNNNKANFDQLMSTNVEFSQEYSFFNCKLWCYQDETFFKASKHFSYASTSYPWENSCQAEDLVDEHHNVFRIETL